MYTVHVISVHYMYTVHCIVYIVQCSLCSVHCTVYIAYWHTIYTVQYTFYCVCIVQNKNVHYMYIVQCTSYTVHCTLYSVHLTVYIVHPISWYSVSFHANISIITIIILIIIVFCWLSPAFYASGTSGILVTFPDATVASGDLALFNRPKIAKWPLFGEVDITTQWTAWTLT